MTEVLILLVVIFFIWIRWSRYFINKQIVESVHEVEVGKPVRTLVHYSEFLRYFKLRHTRRNEVIVIEFKDKKINIIEDEDETVLYIDEEKEK